MAEDVFFHRGHRVFVAAFPEGDGIAWEFRIDQGKSVVLGKSSAQDEANALIEARSAAISVIDLRSEIG